MTEDQAAQIILIRAVEECDKEAFPDDDLKNAFARAGSPIGDTNWFLNRATYLIEHLSPPYRLILQMIKIPDRFLIPLCFLTFILGMATNYIGPPGKIHVIFNPILLLVGWNYLVYGLLIIGIVYPWFKKVKETKRLVALSSASKKGVESLKKPLLKSKGSHSKLPWKLRVFFPSIWTTVNKFSAIFSGTSHRVAVNA